jgi:hypothetical protein
VAEQPVNRDGETCGEAGCDVGFGIGVGGGGTGVEMVSVAEVVSLVEINAVVMEVVPLIEVVDDKVLLESVDETGPDITPVLTVSVWDDPNPFSAIAILAISVGAAFVLCVNSPIPPPAATRTAKVTIRTV